MVGEIASAGAAAGLAAGGYAYAAMWPTSQIFGHTIIAGHDPSQIALTYDDGPNDPHTFRLLDVLARNGVSATFFVIGKFARQRPDIVKKLAAAGHLVGNHTMTHPLLVTRSPSIVRQQLRDANAAIEDALGARVEFFRPPHGGRRPDVLRAARELGLKTVLWNVMGHDWNAKSAETIEQRVAAGVERNRQQGLGSNVLLHDGAQAGIGADRSRTVAATAALLTRWKDAGFRFVTVDAWA
jgi:peptidoglycan/xylan/chitin deacetylase (PgdA/CDA1 family)